MTVVEGIRGTGDCGGRDTRHGDCGGRDTRHGDWEWKADAAR